MTEAQRRVLEAMAAGHSIEVDDDSHGTQSGIRQGWRRIDRPTFEGLCNNGLIELTEERRIILSTYDITPAGRKAIKEADDAT